jgi:hypothetical protein
LVCRQVQERHIPIFIISYPATIHPLYTTLARYGATFAVVENHSRLLHPLTHLQEILAAVISRTESDTVEKLHEAHYNSLAFAGTFTYDKEETSGDDLIITLNVPDEEKVEYFEVKDPSGKKRIFSKFEDGMVYFKFSGHLPSGIWSYHAKLYHDSVFPETKMLVDVVTKSESQTGIVVDVFTSRDGVIYNSDDVVVVDETLKETGSASEASTAGSESPSLSPNSPPPIRVFARVMRNGLPVLNAAAVAELYMPGSLEDGSMYTLQLHDNGLGYPDITEGDGIYTAYVPGHAMVAGYYAVRLSVTDNGGQALQPRGLRKGK